jgi:hypothetical protein
VVAGTFYKSMTIPSCGRGRLRDGLVREGRTTVFFNGRGVALRDVPTSEMKIFVLHPSVKIGFKFD